MNYNKSNLPINKKECEKIIKKVKLGDTRLSKDPSYTSCMRIFTKDIYTNSQILQTSYSKKLQDTKHILTNRIKNYYMLRIKLALIKEDDCLENKTFDNGAIGYTIKNIINLEKKIGSKSRYGSIYLTSVSSIANSFPIATKLMIYNPNNLYEVQIMKKITNNIILKGLSRHFLLIYGSSVCSKRIAKKLKLISINEVADGDLKMLINMSDVVGNSELMFNLFIQTYISIATFHNLVKYVHRDTHYGNFLYQTNTEKGYYHYTFNGKDYYLKSCKYNLMIYDYGFARKIDIINNDVETIVKKKEEIYEDYKKILYSFITKKYKGWIKLRNILDINIISLMIYFSNLLDKYIENELIYNVEHISSQFASLLFTYIIENMFLKYAPNDMFITQRPPNVINKIPFRID